MKTLLGKYVISIATLVAAAGAAHAATILYNTADATYSQNFNTLSASGTSQTFISGTTIAGWHVNSRGSNEIAVTNGGASILSSNVGTQGSIGTAASGERALGLQPGISGTPFLHIGAQFENGTGLTLDGFSLGFTGEQWRRISGDPATTLSFEYQVFAGAGSLTAASGWTAVSDLNFTSPNLTGTSSNLDGNDAANRLVVAPVNVGSVNWQDGNELWVRWSAPQGAGVGRHMVAIDDVNFSASVIPEPASSALVMVGVGALALLRRRSSGN